MSGLTNPGGGAGEEPLLGRLEDPSTVHGRLQRGTGDGYLEVLQLATAEATELALDCIVRDPRVDQQVESRDRYYADLMRDLHVDPDRLRPSVLPDPLPYRDHRLAVGVLAELATDGDERAGQVLLEHVRSGTQWDDAVYAVSQVPGDLYRSLPVALTERFDVQERNEVVRRWRTEVLWDELVADHAWLRDALTFKDNRKSHSRAVVELPSMDLSAADLLGFKWPNVLPKRLLHRLSVMLRDGERDDLYAALEADGTASFVAFQALARLKDPAGLDAAARLLTANESGRGRMEAIRYVKSLDPQHTLDLARRWHTAEDGRGVAGREVLVAHAVQSDLAMLASAAETAWEKREFYGLCSYVDALARFPDDLPVGFVTTVFQEAEYSYARKRAARALVASQGGVLRAHLCNAALWDCEEEIQDYGLAAFGSRTVNDRVALLRARKRLLDTSKA